MATGDLSTECWRAARALVVLMVVTGYEHLKARPADAVTPGPAANPALALTGAGCRADDEHTA